MVVQCTILEFMMAYELSNLGILDELRLKWFSSPFIFMEYPAGKNLFLKVYDGLWMVKYSVHEAYGIQDVRMFLDLLQWCQPNFLTATRRPGLRNLFSGPFATYNWSREATMSWQSLKQNLISHLLQVITKKSPNNMVSAMSISTHGRKGASHLQKWWNTFPSSLRFAIIHSFLIF